MVRRREPSAHFRWVPARTVRGPRVVEPDLVLLIGFPNRVGVWLADLPTSHCGLGCRAGLAVDCRVRRRGEPVFDSGPRSPQARNPRPGACVTWRSMGRHTTSLNQCSLSARSCERMTEAHQHALSGCQGDCPLRHGRPVHDQTDAGIFLQNEHNRESRRHTQFR